MNGMSSTYINMSASDTMGKRVTVEINCACQYVVAQAYLTEVTSAGAHMGYISSYDCIPSDWDYAVIQVYNPNSFFQQPYLYADRVVKVVFGAMVGGSSVHYVQVLCNMLFW